MTSLRFLACFPGERGFWRSYLKLDFSMNLQRPLRQWGTRYVTVLVASCDEDFKVCSNVGSKCTSHSPQCKLPDVFSIRKQPLCWNVHTDIPSLPFCIDIEKLKQDAGRQNNESLMSLQWQVTADVSHYLCTAEKINISIYGNERKFARWKMGISRFLLSSFTVRVTQTQKCLRQLVTVGLLVTRLQTKW
jgi:hypothetical protein